MANPIVRAVGTEVEGTGAIVVAWPTHEINDIGILLVESANQAVSTPAGWTLINNTGTGLAGAALATGIYAFWKRAASAAEASVSVADSGARQIGVIVSVSGCITTGSPIDVSGVSVAASSASVSFPGVTTTVAETLVFNVLTNSLAVAANTVRPSSLVNAALSSLVKRVNTQADGIGGGTSTGHELPVGLFSFGSGGVNGDVGEAPDLTLNAPTCTACMFVPNLATIGDQIRYADEHNILLILQPAGNKASFSTTINGTVTLDMGKFEANVRRFRPDDDNTAFPDRLLFADAIRRRRIVLYGIDEPNLTNAQNPGVPDISPVQANQMGLIHKAVWLGYQPLTFIRVPAQPMRDGWGGLGRPSGGWTGFDYLWLQYNNTHGKGGASITGAWLTAEDPANVLEEQRQIISVNNLQLGVAMSLNIWAGGIGVDTLGVAARWDTDGPGGGSTLGVVLGDREGASMATVSTTTPVSTSVKSLVANPNWIRKVAERAAADPDLPFLLLWQHATATNASNEFVNYYQRADFQSALDDAITTGAARTTFNGWRTAKQ